MHEKINNYIKDNKMWMKNKIFKEDLERLINSEYIPWEELRDATILVTGATGVIGYNLVSGLVYANIKKDLNMRILALVRDVEKAKEKYTEQLEEDDSICFLGGNVEHAPKIEEKINYIVHGASPTTSDYFVEHPVETIKTAVEGTMNMLELARDRKVRGFVYLSSMEVYGSPQTEAMLAEEDLGYINPLNIRNCYPESKRQCEAMCAAYASEYSVPAKIIRLAQTFGLGVDRHDSRVFAEFARCVMEEKNIVLLTDGGSKRCYLYTMDAVSAILTVLLKGKMGQAYNAANSKSYCSVREMAEMVAEKFGGEKVKVKLSEDKTDIRKFPPPHFYNLDVKKMNELRWNATKNLQDMYDALIKDFRELNGV